MLEKRPFTYLVIKASGSVEAEQIVEILSANDRRASEPSIFGYTVMVHMRVENDTEDLRNMLNVLQKQFPEGTNMTASQTYVGRMSSESKQKYKRLIVPALAGYIATVIGVFIVNWNAVSARVLAEALLGSLFPAGMALALKIYEEYR